MSRDLRVADFVRDEVSRILQRDMRDPRVGAFVSVNDVKVSKDLFYAEINVTTYQANDDEAKSEQEAMEKAHGHEGLQALVLSEEAGDEKRG